MEKETTIRVTFKLYPSSIQKIIDYLKLNVQTYPEDKAVKSVIKCLKSEGARFKLKRTLHIVSVKGVNNNGECSAEFSTNTKKGRKIDQLFKDLATSRDYKSFLVTKTGYFSLHKDNILIEEVEVQDTYRSNKYEKQTFKVTKGLLSGEKIRVTFIHEKGFIYIVNLKYRPKLNIELQFYNVLYFINI